MKKTILVSGLILLCAIGICETWNPIVAVWSSRGDSYLYVDQVSPSSITDITLYSRCLTKAEMRQEMKTFGPLVDPSRRREALAVVGAVLSAIMAALCALGVGK